MSQDLISDTLNQMMNSLKAGNNTVTVKRSSKLLLSILAFAKLKGYIKGYKLQGYSLTIEFDKLNSCGAIKPRYFVKSSEIEKYTKRYLPSKDIGTIIVSTSQGIMAHQTTQERKIGGSLLAYFY